jgi:YD repeat-containing protein
MKAFIGIFLLTLLTGACNAQYYYKDLVATRASITLWQVYKTNHVRSARLSSFEGDGQPTDGFQVDQTVSGDFSSMTTHSKTNGTTESWTIAAYSPQGLLVSITDTSDTYQSVSTYQYDSRNRLVSITNISTETDNHVQATEEHHWQYGADDKPVALLKIKNGSDTTFVRFISDTKGNIGEERATRNKEALPPIYYYYDDSNRLTDVVRYNLKAQRLLPDNIFEYGEGDRLTSLLAVQEGAGSYQKWIYEYNEKGLKSKESCFSKQRELLGHIEYQYTYK